MSSLEGAAAAAGDRKIVAAAVLFDFCVAVFLRLGVPEADARLLADSLLQADLRGVETHGAFQVRLYVDRIKAGGTLARTETAVLSDGGATLVLDGGDGIGQVVAARAMGLAIERARQHGIAVVGVRGSNHVGALAYYSRMAVAEDMIGFASSGSAPSVAPWGGLTPLLSTNPWSIAIPAGEESPVVVDFANTAMNNFKATWMAERGEKLPPGAALNHVGEPTDDPAEALKGLFLPIGGHKGYGIMVALEVLSSILPGAAFSTAIPKHLEVGKPQRLGHLMLALSLDRFGPVAEFKGRVDHLIRMLRASRGAPGVERIWVPGEKSELLARRRLVEGIPLRATTVGMLRGVAAELSLQAPC